MSSEVSHVPRRCAAPNAIDVPTEEAAERGYVVSDAVDGPVEVPDRHRKADGFTEFGDGSDAEDVDGQGDRYPNEQMEHAAAAVVGRRLMGLGYVAVGCAHGLIVGMERGLLEGGSVGVGWR